MKVYLCAQRTNKERGYRLCMGCRGAFLQSEMIEDERQPDHWFHPSCLARLNRDRGALMACEGCGRAHPGYDPDHEERAEKWQRDVRNTWWCNRCTAGL